MRQLLYKSLVLPQSSSSAVWHTNCSYALSTKIERLQNYAMRIILDETPRTPSAALIVRLDWTSLNKRRLNSPLCTVHRCVLRQAPEELINLTLLLEDQTNYIFRDPFTDKLRLSFAFQGALRYNLLPQRIRRAPGVTSFKLALTLTNNNLL